MAADQRKKRLNTASIASSREQCGAKRKKLQLPQYRLNMRSNISLEWNDKKKSVIAKREQIGLTQRELIPFVDYAPHCNNILADVLVVPQQIFELENLTEVLSYEVWQTHLSEYERNLLSQFLPKGADAHQVVQKLLEGDNFFFGNPFLKWGASLCVGNLHPDAVLHKEQCFKANKKAYYSELQKYHNGMIGNLLIWKERCLSCEVPEREIVQKIWRSRKHAEKNLSNHVNEARFHDPEENLGATSESRSWAAEEKACSSDNHHLTIKCEELQRRKGFSEEKYDNSSDGLKVVLKPKKGEKLHSQHIQCGDGAKYMSYIKVSKEQHQHVKSSMKHSSNSIQSRSLNRVLGNLDTFHVQPFEVFEEEERKKLHEYWLKLVNKELPAALSNWRRRQLQKWQLIISLKEEMEENLKFLKEGEGKENTHSMLPAQMDRVADHEPPITIQFEKEKSDVLLQQQMDNGVANHEPTIALEDEVKKNQNNGILQEQTDNGAASHEPTIEDDDESVPVSTQSQHMLQIPSLTGSHESHPMNLDSEDNNLISRTDDVPPNLMEYPENSSHVDVAVSQGDPLSSTSDFWPAVSMPDPYYHSNSLNHEYTCASELSLGHPQVIEEQPTQLIDLKSDMHEDDTGKDMLHRQSSDGAFLHPYPSQDRNELLQRFFKGQGVLPYHHEEKQTRLDFHRPANVLMETGQFSGHFREELNPSLPLELRQKRLNELYMHQDIQENMYSDGSRYSIPRQEHFSPVNIQDWAIDTGRMPVPLQSHLNGGEMLSQNWYSGEHQARGGWSGLDVAVGRNNSIANRNNADQSLFSVLSQCNGLRASAPYDSIGSTEQFIQSGNYGRVGGGPTPSSVLPQTSHPLDYLSGHEASATVKNNIGWMNLPHQNSALQDSMAKPFSRSWNH